MGTAEPLGLLPLTQVGDGPDIQSESERVAWLRLRQVHLKRRTMLGRLEHPTMHEGVTPHTV